MAGAQAVRSMTVLSVEEGQLRTRVSVGRGEVDMVVDTGSPVTLLPKCFVPADVALQPPTEMLQAYGGAQLQTLGTCDMTLGYKGKKASVKVYVVPHGTPIMGLDVM